MKDVKMLSYGVYNCMYINDFLYGVIVDMEGVLERAGLYRHRVKRDYRLLRKAFKEYNGRIVSCVNRSGDVDSFCEQCDEFSRQLEGRWKVWYYSVRNAIINEYKEQYRYLDLIVFSYIGSRLFNAALQNIWNWHCWIRSQDVPSGSLSLLDVIPLFNRFSFFLGEVLEGIKFESKVIKDDSPELAEELFLKDFFSPEVVVRAIEAGGEEVEGKEGLVRVPFVEFPKKQEVFEKRF